MKRPWIATAVLWVIGLVALPVLVGAPGLLRMVSGPPEVRGFTLFMEVMILLSIVWLAALVWVAFQHRGRSRTVVLGVTAAAFLGVGLLSMFGPKTTMSVEIKLPDPIKP